MPDQKLKEALLRLKEAIRETAPDDIQSRELLNKLGDHLKTKSNTSRQTEERSQLLKILDEKVIYFESTHPVVSGILEEIIGILTRMGI